MSNRKNIFDIGDRVSHKPKFWNELEKFYGKDVMKDNNTLGPYLDASWDIWEDDGYYGISDRDTVIHKAWMEIKNKKIDIPKNLWKKFGLLDVLGEFLESYAGYDPIPNWNRGSKIMASKCYNTINELKKVARELKALNYDFDKVQIYSTTKNYKMRDTHLFTGSVKEAIEKLKTLKNKGTKYFEVVNASKYPIKKICEGDSDFCIKELKKINN